MPVFEFSSPSGRKYRVTGPEGSTAEQAWDQLKEHVATSIDTSKPIPEVRQQIASLEEPFRERALDKWARAYVAQERQQSGAGGMADNVVRTITRGTFVGPFLDEATAATNAGLFGITGGAVGAPYDESLAYQRARDEAVDTDYPVLSTVGKVAGGLAGGIGALKAGSTAAQQGAGLLVGGPIGAFSPNLSVGGTVRNMAAGGGYAGVAGFGGAQGKEGEQGLEAFGTRAEEAVQAAPIGAAVGGAAPLVLGAVGAGAQKAGEVLSPMLARADASLAPTLQRMGLRAAEQPPRSLSAAAVPRPVAPAPAEAAADQIIANQLSRAGVTTTDLRQRLAEASDVATMGSNSRAQQMLAPVDLDESLQRLAGSAARQQPGAANIAREFIGARQTGVTPAATAADDLAARTGLPTRPEFAPPMTGAQAEVALGSRFATAEKQLVPMGQGERVLDGLKRALRIADADHHGHAGTGYRTQQALVQRAREEANQYYDAVRKAAEGVDIRPTIAPLLNDILAVANSPETGRTTANLLRAFVREFTQGTGKGREYVSSFSAVDEAKKAVDAVIDKALRAGDANVARVLGDPLRRMIDAIDSIQINDIGNLYRQARNNFAGNAAMRDALELGTKALRDNSEVVADQFAALATEGERKLARLGLYTAAQDLVRRKGRTADITRLFESPRVQEILRVAIPRSESRDDVFANRPERFGAFLGNERSMVGTRNVVQGNSMTARNLADDEAFENLSQLGSTIEEFTRSPSVMQLGMRFVQGLLDRLFGMRPDTAEAIARRLFTANAADRERLLLALDERMGPTRAAQFARYLEEYRRSLAAGPAMATGAAPQE